MGREVALNAEMLTEVPDDRVQVPARRNSLLSRLHSSEANTSTAASPRRSNGKYLDLRILVLVGFWATQSRQRTLKLRHCKATCTQLLIRLHVYLL